MHPKSIELFDAIRDNDYETLKQFIHTHPHSTWLLHEVTVRNDQGEQQLLLSALDYSLTLFRMRTINIFLDKLSYDANVGARTYEALQSFHYALLKVTQHFCKPLKNWDDFKAFYEQPESKFTFLVETQKDWISWGYHVASSTSAAYSAVTEMAYIKPEIQSYIRAYAIATAMNSVLSENQSNIDTLKTLSLTIPTWVQKEIFYQHSNWLSSWVKVTKSVELLNILKEACDLLILNRGDIFDEISLESASKILLLCAKAYPFSTPQQKSYWQNLSRTILIQFHSSPSDTHKLFEPLLDKYWLRTDDNIPLVESTLLQRLGFERIAHYLRGYQQNSLADKITSKKPVYLHPGLGKGVDLMGYFHLANPQKCFVVTGSLDEDSKKYLHLLLMNNPSISLSYASTDLFEVNPLKLFPYAPNRVYIDISDARQLAHVAAQAEINSHTQKQLGFALSRKLILEQGNLSCLHDVQKILGSEQTVTVLVLDTLENRHIEADMILSQNEVGLGPQMLAKTAERPHAFHEVYQKLNWTVCATACSHETQIDVLKQALVKKQPLMFIFHRNHFDQAFFLKAETLLKEYNQGRAAGEPEAICMLRFDNLDATASKQDPIITDCDLVITEIVTKPGPLCIAQLCKQPGLYAQATVRNMEMSLMSTLSVMPVDDDSDNDLDEEQVAKKKQQVFVT